MDDSFSNRCRACAGRQEHSGKIISIFERNICEMFTNCTALKIVSNDSLPSHICIDCFGLLSNFNDFRQKCIDSETLFREEIATDSIKVESLDETPIKYEDNEQTRDFEPELFETEYRDIVGKHDPDSITESVPTDVQIPIPEANPFDDVKFICDYCRKVFDKKTNIRSHMRKHENEMLLKSRLEHIPCTEEGCHKFFATKGQFDNHTRHVHRTLKRAKKFSCTQCPKWFAVEHKLGAHIRRVHEGLKPYKCPHCEKDVCKYRTYVDHIRFNHSSVECEKFPCSYDGCDKEYRLKGTLKIHIERVHLGIMKKAKGQKFICEQCGRSFTNGYNLRNHSYSHTGNYPFLCKMCPKKFPTKDRLKIHVMRHLNEKPFECPTCGARKTTNKELQAHLNFHSKAKTYPCKQCDRVFPSYGAIDRHVRIHHRNHKPYICPHCEKAFAKAETMKNHVMTHTGEKPFACTVCDRRFIQSVAMKAHMKVHAKKSKTSTSERN